MDADAAREHALPCPPALADRTRRGISEVGSNKLRNQSSSPLLAEANRTKFALHPQLSDQPQDRPLLILCLISLFLSVARPQAAAGPGRCSAYLTGNGPSSREQNRKNYCKGVAEGVGHAPHATHYDCVPCPGCHATYYQRRVTDSSLLAVSRIQAQHGPSD